MNAKTFFKINIFLIFLGLFLSAGTMIVVDPYFHHHKPLSFIAYRLDNQRYINDGIVKHFDYDSIITGTSMTENFKSSQFDELFNTNSIKVPFSGGSYREINDNIKVALENNDKIKYVLRGLDYKKINQNHKYRTYSNYPEYLYDNKLSNDYKYWWNKDIWYKGIFVNLRYNLKRNKTTTFDEYSYWSDQFTPGKKEVLKRYERPNHSAEKLTLTDVDIKRIDKNIEENVVNLAKEYPNVKFIYFITPYSIVYWDKLNQKNEIEKQIDSEKILIEKILEVPNIELYSFFDNYELITDLNNYKDPEHYMGKINDQILEWIKEGKYRLTKENYEKYLESNLQFYKNYNYDSIFRDEKK